MVLDWDLWALDEHKHKFFIFRPPLVFVFSNSAKLYFAQCSRKNGPWLRPWPNVNPLLSKCRNDLLINAFSHCHASSTMNLNIFKSSPLVCILLKRPALTFLPAWKTDVRPATTPGWHTFDKLDLLRHQVVNISKAFYKLPCLLRVSFNGLRGTQLVESESENSDKDQKWKITGRKWKWEFGFESRN